MNMCLSLKYSAFISTNVLWQYLTYRTSKIFDTPILSTFLVGGALSSMLILFLHILTLPKIETEVESSFHDAPTLFRGHTPAPLSPTPSGDEVDASDPYVIEIQYSGSNRMPLQGS